MKNFIVLNLCVLLIVSCSMDKNKAIEHNIKAKEFYINDDIKNASSEIEIAISLDSSNLDFQITKGKILTETDNYEQAIIILKGLLSRNFKVDTVNFNIGSCYFSYGNYFSTKQDDEDKAKEFYEKAATYYNYALNTNTQYFDAYVEKQKVLHNLDHNDEALIVLNTAITLFPDSILLICNRGVEKLYLGDLTGAMTDLNNSIQSNKLDSMDFASAYRFRGNLYLKKGNSDQAISDLTNALKLNPKDEFALVTRAECYKEKGLKDKACEDYRKAADLGFVSIYKTIKEYCN
ncbi:MAG: tetratricopeptide repeat protein [Bacteroidota bacterium]